MASALTPPSRLIYIAIFETLTCPVELNARVTAATKCWTKYHPVSSVLTEYAAIGIANAVFRTDNTLALPIKIE